MDNRLNVTVQFHPSSDSEATLYDRIVQAMTHLERYGHARSWAVELIPPVPDREHVGFAFVVSFVGDQQRVKSDLCQAEGVRYTYTPPPLHTTRTAR